MPEDNFWMEEGHPFRELISATFGDVIRLVMRSVDRVGKHEETRA